MTRFSGGLSVAGGEGRAERERELRKRMESNVSKDILFRRALP